MVKWGFPVGPFKLLDEVGVDVGAKVQQILEKAYGTRMQGTGIVGKMLEAGRIGKKAKKGFYDYGKKAKGKSVDPDVYKVLGVTPGTAPDEQAIMTRCSLPLLNEAARCLDEKVIPSARDGDIGAVFGIGFPPFRGGPFRHADDLGAATVVEQLRELEKQHGERFAPAEGLVKQAGDGGRFY
jgi:3-hydroxyacyl-CoA dehydrogenase/enoyl-CoA hydratase/3-hydroxybutyryl-CoA epimerase